MSALLERVEQFVADMKKRSRPRKVDLSTIPEFWDAVQKFENEDLRRLCIAGLETAPAAFWKIPGSFSTGVHNEKEHGWGETKLDPDTGLYLVMKIGGKAVHTLRVLAFAEIFLYAEEAEIWNFQMTKVTAMRPGNELTSRERDIVRLCCLWHDIFSVGTIDDCAPGDFKAMDKKHPHYHRQEFEGFRDMVPASEWELILKIIGQHMWKWECAAFLLVNRGLAA